MYIIQGWYIKDNCWGMYDFCDDLESARHFAQGAALKLKSSSRIIHGGMVVAEYSYSRMIRERLC